MRRGIPTKIRGVIYPSQAAAARALGVSQTTVFHAIEAGREDQVGLGRPGAPPKPCYMNGRRWPSIRAAAAALGVSKTAISRARRQGRLEVRAKERA